MTDLPKERDIYRVDLGNKYEDNVSSSPTVCLNIYIYNLKFRQKYLHAFSNISFHSRLEITLKNRSLRGHVLTGNECHTINIVYVIVDKLL